MNAKIIFMELLILIISAVIAAICKCVGLMSHSFFWTISMITGFICGIIID